MPEHCAETGRCGQPCRAACSAEPVFVGLGGGRSPSRQLGDKRLPPLPKADNDKRCLCQAESLRKSVGNPGPWSSSGNTGRPTAAIISATTVIDPSPLGPASSGYEANLRGHANSGDMLGATWRKGWGCFIVCEPSGQHLQCRAATCIHRNRTLELRR